MIKQLTQHLMLVFLDFTVSLGVWKDLNKVLCEGTPKDQNERLWEGVMFQLPRDSGCLPCTLLHRTHAPLLPLLSEGPGGPEVGGAVVREPEGLQLSAGLGMGREESEGRQHGALGAGECLSVHLIYSVGHMGSHPALRPAPCSEALSSWTRQSRPQMRGGWCRGPPGHPSDLVSCVLQVSVKNTPQSLPQLYKRKPQIEPSCS